MQNRTEDRTEQRLDRLRGRAPRRRHDARTIAALTRNPGCARRAVLDAAGVDKELLARQIGFAAPFGQSPFAIVRGNVFEARVTADECAALLTLLAECLDTDAEAGADEATSSDVIYLDLGASGAGPDAEGPARRLERTEAVLRSEAAARAGAGSRAETRAEPRRTVLLAHPLLRLAVGGQDVYLEPDLLVIRPDGRAHVVEIKSFAVVDGQADGEKVAAAAVQAAVYVLALRRMLGTPAAVSHDVVLVCPKDFSNVPLATRVDVRRQLLALDHQLARLTTVQTLLDALPPEVTFDLAPAADGAPTRPAGELTDALDQLPARYAPDCLSVCELAFRCRQEAAGRTAALGASVREELGGIDTVAEVLDLAGGARTPTESQAEAAAHLMITARMYAEGLSAGQALAPPLAPLPAPAQLQASLSASHPVPASASASVSGGEHG
ncbi:hypothetical protein [Parafrankia sp. EUN1f]|uniref:hypothetical protein n=1 Tax=Parafrankia sp. EUN1f TaxID=102897 RepID=UPI0001C45FB6|nr:hypothetical protein [Parafrankia sp. EUN1f]EFC81378.1 hypothetical protein FrEUN1fDRAFT_5481 [Parafrankia sp. EUN1f]